MSDEIRDLKREIEVLRAQLEQATLGEGESYYYSPEAQHALANSGQIPERGLSPKTVEKIIENTHTLDFNQKLNTSSYVNVNFEQEEESVALMGLRVNLADQTVYPQSYKLHDSGVNMIARLWQCPQPVDFDE